MARTKKKKSEEEKGPESSSFTVMFTALSIILLAFFILLKSMSATDEKKKRIALGSLFGTFGIMPGGENFDKKGKYYSRLIPMVEKNSIFTGLAKEKELMESTGLASGTDLEVERTVDGIKVTMKAPMLFKSQSWSLNPRSFPVMDRLGLILLQVGRPVDVVGYVSKRRTVGALRVEDWELSLGRAVSVANYFVNAVGVPPNLLRAVGRGNHDHREKGLTLNFKGNDCVVIFIRASNHEPVAKPVTPDVMKKIVPGKVQ
ncbi:OmpA family protein [Myxococcota bacterium]|nr:OmpA family protein [Myxococcota bacterium]MBU1383092.1 OmpA family protein [Myxococcota bacterium]MBU1497970.1 OmpA family protein [Myxococcota bacterium]